MFRIRPGASAPRPPFPHACGDVPADGTIMTKGIDFSPRLWGCSVAGGVRGNQPHLFPTPVGMFRTRAFVGPPRPAFPHACGDVPWTPTLELDVSRFSPRLWGCSELVYRQQAGHCLFPTPVGMFRSRPRSRKSTASFPHACGDVPAREAALIAGFSFSPRLWGCSRYNVALRPRLLLFPTPVGMFRRSPTTGASASPFPHACGDVPEATPSSASPSVFSPRLWGCSGDEARGVERPALFPTPVGMFRGRGCRRRGCRAFPHACGDVPAEAIADPETRLFSPRLWGCSGR